MLAPRQYLLLSWGIAWSAITTCLSTLHSGMIHITTIVWDETNRAFHVVGCCLIIMRSMKIILLGVENIPGLIYFPNADHIFKGLLGQTDKFSGLFFIFHAWIKRGAKGKKRKKKGPVDFNKCKWGFCTN